jgi:hypothetical protein
VRRAFEQPENILTKVGNQVLVYASHVEANVDGIRDEEKDNLVSHISMSQMGRVEIRNVRVLASNVDPLNIKANGVFIKQASIVSRDTTLLIRHEVQKALRAHESEEPDI